MKQASKNTLNVCFHDSCFLCGVYQKCRKLIKQKCADRSEEIVKLTVITYAMVKATKNKVTVSRFLTIQTSFLRCVGNTEN